ncbi:uncharacterized protein LOC103502625 isoform X1 [Cucumis melo]|uniref:Uncharacterized protein LOC103502625 isoform X1 n=1 Tax=Cucumis melo TaxID=3656 RepID=A0A1S3CME9_CUCME|nr:uncharacterized protein LOC103502625 isoform X1 [Cucumis melo]XP_008464852.1 uncharacterized protein LOC103502625 isoform X1 [Cucumis melo]
MIDSKLNSGGMSSCETNLCVYQSKQSPIAQKKVALRDVQNDNRSIIYNYPETSCSLGGKLMNGSKLSGSKRSNPTCSPSSAIHQSFKGIGVNEHNVYANGEVDVKPGKKRASGGSTSCAPAFSSFLATSPMAFSPVRSSFPIFTEKPGNFLAVTGSNLLGIPPGLEILRSDDSNGITDEQRTERLFNLQKLLKHFDKSDQKGVIEIVLHGLPPSELSNFAINLEKRSMHLSVEEGKEIQRMKALNILSNLQ